MINQQQLQSLDYFFSGTNDPYGTLFGFSGNTF